MLFLLTSPSFLYLSDHRWKSYHKTCNCMKEFMANYKLLYMYRGFCTKTNSKRLFFLFINLKNKWKELVQLYMNLTFKLLNCPTVSLITPFIWAGLKVNDVIFIYLIVYRVDKLTTKICQKIDLIYFLVEYIYIDSVVYVNL